MDEYGMGVDRRQHHGLVRLGGFAVLLGLAIHIVVNFVLKEMPPQDPSLAELQAYLAGEAPTWAIVHGLRYVAFLCIALFASGLFARTCCCRPSRPTGWGVVGLLGATMLLANALITNGIETFVFLDFELLSARAELFWALFYATRVLWTAEIAAWGVLTLGFSVAGWRSATIPKWLAMFGLLSATACVLSAAFIVSILNDGPASVLIEVASLTGLAWFGIVGVHMLRRGSS